VAEHIRGKDEAGESRIVLTDDAGRLQSAEPTGRLLAQLILETRAVRLGVEMQLKLKTGALLHLAAKAR
jgi:hypothetical protein